MPYASLRVELLAAREEREARRLAAGQDSGQTLLQLGLNLPGADKAPAGSAGLFAWALDQLQRLIPGLVRLRQGADSLGPWALLSAPHPAAATKQLALEIEERQPFARLLDIDVYAAGGVAVGRSELGLPARPCLLCPLPAVECIRLKHHSPLELKGRSDELLAPLRA